MKAMTYRRYGGPDVVTLTEVPKPSPKPNEVLIRILATTVTTGDHRARSLDLPTGFRLIGRLVFGLTRPRQPILGTELAGIVESVGADVVNFNPGDEVIAFPGGAYGSHAEYRTMPETGTIAVKPANLSFEEAASLSFGSMTALPFLRDKARIKAGDSVLVVGASGAVGTAAVQIARHFGADVAEYGDTSLSSPSADTLPVLAAAIILGGAGIRYAMWRWSLSLEHCFSVPPETDQPLSALPVRLAPYSGGPRPSGISRKLPPLKAAADDRNRVVSD